MAERVPVRRGQAVRGKVKVRQCRARHGPAWNGWARQGEGNAGRSKAWPLIAMQGKVKAMHGRARLGKDWLGRAGHGDARQGEGKVKAMLGMARRGGARQGEGKETKESQHEVRMQKVRS